MEDKKKKGTKLNAKKTYNHVYIENYPVSTVPQTGNYKVQATTGVGRISLLIRK